LTGATGATGAAGAAGGTGLTGATGATGAAGAAGGTGLTGAAGAAGNSATLVRKTTDEGVASSITVQDDDALALSIGANEVWEFEAYVIVTAATSTPDFKFDFTTPSGATINWTAAFVDGTSAAVQSGLVEASATSRSFDVTGAAIDIMLVKGIVVNSTTAGTLQFRFAQNTSDANAITVKANSFIKGMKF